MDERRKNRDNFVAELEALKQEYNYLKLLYENGTFELEQARNALTDSDAKYRLLFSENPQPIWIYDCDTQLFLDVNEAAIRQYGYSRQEFLSMTLHDIQAVEENFQDFYEVREQRHVKKNGELLTVEILSYPVSLNNSTVLHATIHDITNRKQIENKLLESEENFRRSIADSPVGIRIVTVDGKTIYANKTLLDIYEFNSLEEFVNMSKIDRYTSESYKQHQERKEKRKKGQDVFEYEVGFKRSNGDIRHVKVSKKGVLWDGVRHFQVITQDITEQRNAEERLRIFLRVVEQSPNAVCISDLEGVINYVNSRTIELTGFSYDELIGAHTRIFSSGLTPKEEYVQLWQTIKSGNVWRAELCNRKKNGELYWEFVTISPVFDEQDKITHFLSIKVDITEHKEMLQDLILSKESTEKSEIFLRTFIENIPFDIWASDVNNIGILENKMHVDHFGTIIGKTLKNNVAIDQHNIQIWEDSIRRVINGEIIDEECECEVNHQKTIFQQIAFPIYKKEQLIGIAGLNINITDKKLAENALISSEEQLRKFASHLQIVREAERSALAREIHDDLGQILVALKIDTGLLKQKIIKNNSTDYSTDILLKFDSLASLINDTIITVRRIMNGLRSDQLELLGLKAAIAEYLRDFEERHQISCEFKCPIEKPEIDQQQTLALFRILQEAMANISKHAKATVVTVELANSEDKLVMKITDNGVGFDPEHSGRDDSYGLIGMQERVSLLKGHLHIGSKVGQGTTVRIEMPMDVDNTSV